METFIVAVEYRGAALLAGVIADRIPVCEHAYDLDTGVLAGHTALDAPRVGFPVCSRGWNSPPHAARCAGCDTAVQHTLDELIAAAIYLLAGPRPPLLPPTPQTSSDG